MSDWQWAVGVRSEAGKLIDCLGMLMIVLVGLGGFQNYIQCM